MLGGQGAAQARDQRGDDDVRRMLLISLPRREYSRARLTIDVAGQ